ncbi:MAG: PDZ domain-containing protein [Gemmatimonadota bacterium]
MSLIHMKVSISRGAVVAALMLAPALTAAAYALPQVSTKASTAPPRAATVRTRCVGCSDSAKATHETLLSKLDSLRWHFSNRRLTQAEQEVFVRDMAATIMALQQFMEGSGARVRLAPSARGEAAVAGGFAGVAAPGEYTFTVQSVKRGYLGVTFDGPSYGYPAERPDVIRFIQYPKVASVDPASPAERAGLLMGDTLVAMNGTDVVEHSITLSRILVPDEKVMLKVRRDGDAKEFRVVVGEAPAYVARRVPEAASAPPPPSTWEEPTQPRVFVFSNAIGGARVESITEGLSRAIGVKEGVLVIQALPGSPAYVSGLRDGDVIISAAGTTVTTARELNRAVFSADRENGVKLVIVREKKQQDVTLRWK